MPFIPGGNVNALEYLLTSAFSAVAALFSWLARRSGKRNTTGIARLEQRTNGELLDKIRTAVREAVGHDELVAAVSEEAVRDYLDALLVAHIDDHDNHGRSLFDDIHGITERRRPDDGK